jgi:hypothetical protein
MVIKEQANCSSRMKKTSIGLANIFFLKMKDKLNILASTLDILNWILLALRVTKWGLSILQLEK